MFALIISLVKNVLDLYMELYSRVPALLQSSKFTLSTLTVMMSVVANSRCPPSVRSATLMRRRKEAEAETISSAMLLPARSLRRDEGDMPMLSFDSPVTSATVAVKAEPNWASLVIAPRPPLIPRSMTKKVNE